MRRLIFALAGGLITSVCFAAPNGHLEGDTLIISGVEAPPIETSSDSTSEIVLKSDIHTPPPERVNLDESKESGSTQKSDDSSSSDAVLAPIEPPKPVTFWVSHNESPYRALSRWLSKNNMSRLAFSLTPDEQKRLLTPNDKTLNFRAALSESVRELGKALDMPLRLTVQGGIAGVHTLSGPVEIHWIEGDSLQEVIKRLTRAYHWKWYDDKTGRRSWMSEDDYPLMSEYGIVTQQGDIGGALDTVLDGYPVKAQLLTSNHTVFITPRQ